MIKQIKQWLHDLLMFDPTVRRRSVGTCPIIPPQEWPEPSAPPQQRIGVHKTYYTREGLPTTTPHDAVGLVNKYRVLKQQDGQWIEKTTACFVLSPDKPDTYGAASKAAILTYAKVIERQNPQLAHDLTVWVKELNGMAPPFRPLRPSGQQHHPKHLPGFPKRY